MIIETLDDLNAVDCCCGSGFECPIQPAVEGNNVRVDHSPCFVRSVSVGGVSYYYRHYEKQWDISHTTFGVTATDYYLQTRDRRWDAGAKSCGSESVTTDDFDHTIICPETKTETDSTIGTPPSAYTVRETFYKGATGPDPTHEYAATHDQRYTDAYVDVVGELYSEAAPKLADLVSGGTWPLSGFASSYATFGSPASAIRITAGRFRWNIAAHLGAYYKITWDIYFFPAGGGDPVMVSQDNTWEWTGSAGGPPPGSENDWKSPYYTVDAPSSPGENRVVNLRVIGFRSSRFGSLPCAYGESV